MTPRPNPDFPASKADALAWLAPRVRRARIFDQLTFRAVDWATDPAKVLAQITHRFTEPMLIVRSSALDESNAASSNSGVNDSVPNVPRNDPAALTAAIRQVLDSYGSDAPGHQVLVQPMLTGIRWVAVVSTMDRDSAAPYYTFVYSETPEHAEVITSGNGRALRQYVRHHQTTAPCPSPELTLALAAVQEVEGLFSQPLELELAIGADNQLCLFQARPVIDCSRGTRVDPAELAVALTGLAAHLPTPGPTDADIFGVMPDWNPAELIGTKPSPLAFAAYRKLFADLSWAEARRDLGYTDLVGTPLVRSFIGSPFVDVRASFRSLTPAGLSPGLRDRLVSFFLSVLRQHPHLHDKVEFDVVISCASPGWLRKTKRLRANGFSEADIGTLETALAELTAGLLDPERVRRDLALVASLPAVSREGSPLDLLRNALAALEICRRDGAVPFARLARLAFVSVQYLREAVEEATLDRSEFDLFFRSLRTVVAELNAALTRVQTGEESTARFLARFGHLRPGTYDLTSPRYDEAYETYFGPVLQDASSTPSPADSAGSPSNAATPFLLSKYSRRATEGFLRRIGSPLSPEELFAFFRAAIESREDAKLQFTRVLSDALQAIQIAGATVGLGPTELQYLELTDLADAVAAPEHWAEILRARIETNRRRHRLTQSVKLPDLILRAQEAWHFDTHLHAPNFITRANATGPVLDEHSLTRRDLTGAILCLRAADPGFDWVFAHRIGGLITRFGGVNSHMAVRCAELGLPAVIGCGEADFRRWSTARMLRVDCGSQTVSVVL